MRHEVYTRGLTMQDESKLIGDAIEGAVKGVTKGALESVPIYPDALQPAAKELGKTLETAMRLVNAALAPVRGLIWSFEKAETYVYEKVGKKLELLPADQIVPPSPVIAVPAVQALMLTAGEPTLGELYANLLATAMDKSTAEDAHPGFVELIKQMNSDEAKLFQKFGSLGSLPCIRMKIRDADGKGFEQTLIPLFTNAGEVSGCERTDKSDTYVTNLQRLGLLNITFESYYSDDGKYAVLREHATIKRMEERVEKESDAVVEFDKGQILPTAYGIDFYNSCIASKEPGGPERITLEPKKILNFTDY